LNFPYSGLSISSFALSLISILGAIGTTIIGIYLETKIPGSIENEESLEAMLIGICIIGGAGLSLIAIGLGIASFFQKGKNQIFATLGVIFSGLMFFGIIGLIILGLTLG